MVCQMPIHRCLLMAFLTTWFIVVWSNPDETKVLIKFKNSLSNAGLALNGWSELTDPCSGDAVNWVGVKCDAGNVSGLQLESIGLTGIVDTDTLSLLTSLRSLSIVNNSFGGPIPNIKKLVALKSLYLTRNQFSGRIPDDAFDGMVALRQLYMGHNQFTDEIPKSLVKLPRLKDLSLEDNQFQGRIPDFHQMELEMVNIANNQLVGPIPKSLSNMNSTFFAGNKALCGKPLAACKSHKKRVMVVW